MRCLLAGILLVFAAVAGGQRARAAAWLSVQLPSGWSEAEAGDASGGEPDYPTCKFVPDDHRNAVVLVTLLGRGNGRIGDLEALKQFHRGFLCEPYLASPDAGIDAKELKLPGGAAVYASFEDPNLIGKPSKPEDYKVASPVGILFDGGIVAYATVFTDELEGATFDEAFQIVRSINLAARADEAVVRVEGDAIIVSVPSLDAELAVPSRGFSQSGDGLNQSPSYFLLSRDDGVTLSGWLEPVSKYQGFRELWAADRSKMETGGGMKCVEEVFETINGWEAVLYRVEFGKDLAQSNIRACRTLGRTWVDVHLSMMGGQDGSETLRNMKTLRSVLSGLSLKPGQVEAQAGP